MIRQNTSADLDAVVQAACGDERIHLVGESVGGTVVLAYALAHPRRVREGGAPIARLLQRLAQEGCIDGLEARDHEVLGVLETHQIVEGGTLEAAGYPCRSQLVGANHSGYWGHPAVVAAVLEIATGGLQW